MWYSELPDILCMDERKVKILNVLEHFKEKIEEIRAILQKAKHRKNDIL